MIDLTDGTKIIAEFGFRTRNVRITIHFCTPPASSCTPPFILTVRVSITDACCILIFGHACLYLFIHLIYYLYNTL